MLVRIEAPHFVAGSIWKKHEDDWYCIKAAPIIKWMVNKPAREVGQYVRRKGWKYEFIK